MSSRILLASSSVYRAGLLNKLGLSFTQASPSIDESRLGDESPYDMVSRLAEQKALALRAQYAQHIIIASDQIAITKDNHILGKPHTYDKAVSQLSAVSGQKVTFLTSLCVLSPPLSGTTNQHLLRDDEVYETQTSQWRKQLIVEPYYVYFRNLSDKQICNYVAKEKPYDCAGSFKVEGLGISLFSKLEGDDPNALIGLPLIQLCTMLDAINIPVL